MMILANFPSIVNKYASYFESCFTEAGYKYFKKALSGFILSDNTSLEAINRLFIEDARNQSSFNRFFNRQNFDLEELNSRRIAFMQQQSQTAFKLRPDCKGALMIDSTLLKHYGKHFDNIYYHYDYVNHCYRWAHDLVTLHYSDDLTDYPLYYQLWSPPDWERVAEFFMEQKDFTINAEKYKNRQEEPQKWRNYIRSRYRMGCKKYPEVKAIYETKLDIAEHLIGQFCRQHPDWNLPIALDAGFTSPDLCGAITQKYSKDYVGALREDQNLIINGQVVKLKDIVAQIRSDHQSNNSDGKYKLQKVGYTYRQEKKTVYAHFGNYRVNNYDKKQRLVISFLKEDLSDKPNFTISNRLDWYPSGILRIRRQRWPIETYHQEAKDEGLEKYQVRNDKAIQTYLAFIVLTYSLLKYAVHDSDLLSSIQKRLQTETGSTLPFLRRLIKAEALLILVEYITMKINQGDSGQAIIQSFAPNIAYI
jgi:hypothetical protein